MYVEILAVTLCLSNCKSKNILFFKLKTSLIIIQPIVKYVIAEYHVSQYQKVSQSQQF